MQVRQVLLWIFRVNLGLALIGYGLAAVLSCTVASDAVRGCKRLPGIEPLITFLTLYVGWGLVFVGWPCLLLVGAIELRSSLKAFLGRLTGRREPSEEA